MLAGLSLSFFNQFIHRLIGSASSTIGMVSSAENWYNEKCLGLFNIAV